MFLGKILKWNLYIIFDLCLLRILQHLTSWGHTTIACQNCICMVLLCCNGGQTSIWCMYKAYKFSKFDITIKNFEVFNFEIFVFNSAMMIIHYFIETGIFIIRKVLILPKCLYFVHNAINMFIDDNELLSFVKICSL